MVWMFQGTPTHSTEWVRLSLLALLGLVRYALDKVFIEFYKGKNR